MEWQDNLKSPICKRSLKPHTNLQIKRNFGYVKYYLGSPSLHVSLGFIFIATFLLLCRVYFYRLCAHVYRRLVVISTGPLSALDRKSCRCPSPLKKMFLHFRCALHSNIAPMGFGYKKQCLVIKF